MFRITKVDGTVEMQKEVRYVMLQENGHLVITENKYKAQGIIADDNNNIYALEGRGLDEKYETVELKELTVEDYMLYINEKLEQNAEKQNAMLENQSAQDEVLAELLLNSLEVQGNV